MLRVSQLQCRRGDRLLFSGLDFSVRGGDVLHVLGPNGAGKTTLLRSLCGLFRPDAGEIRWMDRLVSQDMEGFRRDVLFFGHLNGIKGELTGVENLSVAGMLAGRRWPKEALWGALAAMGLAGFEDWPTKFLSQGQKKRVALARLPLTDAKLWILDEPFTALDTEAVALLRQCIAEHVRKSGMVVLTTHQEAPLTEGPIRRLELGRAGGPVG